MMDLSVYFNSLKRPRDYSARREKEGRLPCRMDLYMTPLIGIANKMESYEAATDYKLPRRNCWDMTTLKIYPYFGSKFILTLDDLLIMSLAFGDVIRKIVNFGVTHGEVTYSNAHDVAVALRNLDNMKCFLVCLIQPWDISKAHKNERSEGPRHRPPCLQQDSLKDQQSKRLPSLQDTLYPPAYSQSVHLHITNLPEHFDQRYRLLSLLPSGATSVKLKKKYILVTLPDISSARRLMACLDDVFTDSSRLSISSVDKRVRACPGSRCRKHGKHHHHSQGLL